jgi:hypothetical protein
MATPSRMPADDVIRAKAAEGHQTQTALALALGVGRTTLRDHLASRPELKADVLAVLQGAIHADREDVTIAKEIPATTKTELDPESDEVRAFLKERGIPESDWVAVSCKVSRYPVQLGDGVVEDANYLSVSCKRKTGMVVLNVVKPQPVVKVRPLKPRKGEPEVVVLAGCHQVPFHDEQAHELMCGFLGLVEPHKVGLLGDFCDYPDVSRYSVNPAYRASVQDTHVVAHRMLSEIVGSAPGAQVEMCKGNHDQRLEDWLLKHAGAVHDVRRHGSDVPWHHPRELLGLDALGIKHHDPVGGQWSRARIQYSPIFAAMHGWRTGKATAARDTARDLGMHVAQVHTHRQAIAPVTIGRDGDGYMVQAVECGAMCKTDQGLGHTNGVADWQQGWAVASVWPDGVPTFELVQVVDGAVRFRGERLSARRLQVAA